MGKPEDHKAAAARGRGRLRASDADREQVIEVLKDAFVQGRLTKHELDSRAGQAFASRTYAELAALTADISAGSAAAPSTFPAPRQPARAQHRTPRSHTARDVAIGSGIGLSIAAAIVLTGLLDAVALLGLLAMPIVAVALVLIVAHLASQQRNSRGQQPPQPGRGGQAPQVQQPGQVGHGPVLPGPRTDQTGADLRTDSSRSVRPHSSGRDARAPRGIRPVPGVV